MFVELPSGDYDRVRPLFESLTFNTEVPSILEGNTRGVIYVDDLSVPRRALMWDNLMAVFLAGDAGKSGFNTGLRAWLADAPVPLAQKYGIDALTVDAADESWQTALPRLLADYRVTQGQRHFYTHTDAHVRIPETPSEYTIEPVTPALLAREDLKGHGWLEGWISSYWPTLERYFNLGIGYVACLDRQAIVSLCISVFVTGTTYEFGTATHEDHRNQGLSTAVAGNCINSALAHEIDPIWHCWADNLPSIAVARKVGFQLEREYEVSKLWIPTLSS